MSAGSRIAAVAVVGAAAAVALAAPASASTDWPVPTAYVFTFPTLDECVTAGVRAEDGNVFTFAGFTCRPGIAGYDLIGEPTGGTFTDSYLFTTATLTECQTAGANGEAASPAAWGSYTCRSGFTGYDLLVSS
ncbi:hypothetical protein [Actinokineospora cianjurensis]|uniref:Subtilisin inhibitor-like n=1 Tax=Actinokineospora cianjurensis TaxID=585224 RepID=A0A421AYX4_9PSEU|nr:hypothetical protein [Actinokineospora cianjurensis]RLK55072.1 hypothetical protein CLV68_5465 [Actinokineospora cianjurensis]